LHPSDLIGFLQGDGLLSRAECSALRKASKDLLESPVRLLRSLNVAAPEDLQRCFQVYFNYPLVTDALVDSLTGDYAALVPVDLALQFGVFGFGQEGNRLYVALEDPTDERVLAALRFFLNCKIVPAAANVYQLSAALERVYGVPAADNGLSTVLDRARGAGAWSQQERELFDRMFEERRAREREAQEEESRRLVRSSAKRRVRPKQPQSSGVQEPSPTATVAIEPAGVQESDQALTAQSEAAVPKTLLEQDKPASLTPVPEPEPSFESLLTEAAEIEDLPPLDDDGFDDGEDFIAQDDVSPMALSALTQRALLKSAMGRDPEQILDLVNGVFAAEDIAFGFGPGGQVVVARKGTPLADEVLMTQTWSTVASVIRMLEKKSQSKAG
jgi:hypothetical protein